MPMRRHTKLGGKLSAEQKTLFAHVVYWPKRASPPSWPWSIEKLSTYLLLLEVLGASQDGQETTSKGPHVFDNEGMERRMG